MRIPTVAYPIANGKKRSGKRVLAIGTDCSCGKMYTAMSMDAEMVSRGMKSDFRATGQTGILITGKGVPLDAVIADFMAGAVEYLTPDNDDDHWDHIEGQGSLYHVSYSGVTMALIHGGQPDALILCHEPTRTHMRGLPGYSVPTLEQLRDTALPMARVANPALSGDGRVDQHQSAGRRRGARLSGRGRGADGAACDGSVPVWCWQAGGCVAGALSPRVAPM